TGVETGALPISGGVQREGGDEQRGDTEGFLAGRRRVHDGAGAGAGRGAVGSHRHGPGDRPVRPEPFLDGPVGEQVGGERPVRGGGAPAGGALAGVLHDGEVALGPAPQRPRLVVTCLDDDLLQPRQGQQQGVVDGVQQPLGEVGGGRVAQGEDDGRVVGGGGAALGGEGEPQQRHVPVPAADLVPQGVAGPGG